MLLHGIYDDKLACVVHTEAYMGHCGLHYFAVTVDAHKHPFFNIFTFFADVVVALVEMRLLLCPIAKLDVDYGLLVVVFHELDSLFKFSQVEETKLSVLKSNNYVIWAS